MLRKRVGAQSAPNSATVVAEITPLAALLLEFPNGFQSEPRSVCITQGVLLHQILLAILYHSPTRVHCRWPSLSSYIGKIKIALRRCLRYCCSSKLFSVISRLNRVSFLVSLEVFLLLLVNAPSLSISPASQVSSPGSWCL